MAMFAGVEPDRLVRFLTEASSWRDDLALGFALPKAAFLKTLLSWPVAGVQGGSIPAAALPYRSWLRQSDPRGTPVGNPLAPTAFFPFPHRLPPGRMTTPCEEAATK